MVTLSWKNIFFVLLASLFFIGIIVISLNILSGSLLVLFILLIIHALAGKYRFLTSLFISFLLSFLVYQYVNNYIDSRDMSLEIKTLIKRSMLIFIVFGLVFTKIFYKQRTFAFTKLPKWNKRITLPFHTIKLSNFLLIGLIVSSTIFIPLFIYKEISYVKQMLVFGILFSVINASLEEIIWRDILLSSLKRYVSTFYAIVITSVGFGLLHISIGIPLIISLLFSLGGLFYATVVLKTNSIYPAIVFHFVINLGMVFNGWII
ncbi:CPBP family intramembrane glutamic endopeptidase [Chengkuizengella axinellae]|uniref:CPBP family intramembrane metalloprotease n=1 Tax=Chengkuizengella axinellae TaxID=3064388 RepID=A0ABT9J0X7_9BACL|nr:CPBP family intramembrane glutamic endopeptidase [Chengkuizengella sp. 2205SS18-9]MDP5275225.1 CPBP family intramembrane metalloprotease [Chengkuizengella sp. 2205SS18-9]